MKHPIYFTQTPCLSQVTDQYLCTSGSPNDTGFVRWFRRPPNDLDSPVYLSLLPVSFRLNPSSLSTQGKWVRIKVCLKVLTTMLGSFPFFVDLVTRISRHGTVVLVLSFSFVTTSFYFISDE